MALPSAENQDVFQARDYQIEMFEESMRRNIIVVMGTGSGKTQIAILRIAAELERCPPEKVGLDLYTRDELELPYGDRLDHLIPTKALAEQQHKELSRQLAAAQSRVITGEDKVDLWKEQWIWDSILKGIQVVVSTHQVLLDALGNGFIHMKRLALLVFDEGMDSDAPCWIQLKNQAHSTRDDHPSNRIMRDHYDSCRVRDPNAVPHVLGLTASPGIKKQVNGVDTIEKNLNSICRTPKLHRSQLMKHMPRPEIEIAQFSCLQSTPESRNLATLIYLYATLNIEEDPYVVQLRASGHDHSSSALVKALMDGKTWCQKQIKTFITTSGILQKELGPWATDYYIAKCVTRFCARSAKRSRGLDDLGSTEKQHLSAAFEKLTWHTHKPPSGVKDEKFSTKLQSLLNALISNTNPKFTGLIFTQTRASVGVLAHLISTHPATKDHFKVGTFIGTSNDERRQTISELVTTESQSASLEDLKNGKKNLIIATSVLEEGIDISACNIVICFEKPPNLKSFIQRRGRARQMESKYIIMLEREASGSSITALQKLEKEMDDKYRDDMRQIQDTLMTEEAEHGHREYEVSPTGAKLTLHSAIQHLEYFCAKLPLADFVINRPIHTFERDQVGEGLVTGKVLLPSSVDPSLQSFESHAPWKTEKMAKRDAAFEACVALHKATLLNDHLLPLLGEEEKKVLADIQTRESKAKCHALLNPWIDIARAWQEGFPLYKHHVELLSSTGDILKTILILPYELLNMQPTELFWDQDLVYTVTVTRSKACTFKDQTVEAMDTASRMLLISVFPTRLSPCDSGLALLFIPKESMVDISSWLADNKGSFDAKDMSNRKGQEMGSVVRSSLQGQSRFTFHGIELRQMLLPTSENLEVPSPHVRAKKISKRTDFMHPVHADQERPKTGSGYQYFPVETCTIDRLPVSMSRFAQFIPSITHDITTHMIVNDLCGTLLKNVAISDRSLVKTAISAPSAGEKTDYQKLEFLGDAILKYLTALNVVCAYPNWHEGYLSRKKDHTVSNSTLSRAALSKGLDRYILTQRFTGLKWKPMFIKGLLENQTQPDREISTKTLADVVEALIGAAYVDGSIPKAIRCLQIFLPEINWLETAHCLSLITVQPYAQLPPTYNGIETNLLGYTFQRKGLLLEALTYASYVGVLPTPSYQRLEFLGDSILDFLITTKIRAVAPNLRHQRMHLIREVVANAHFLAFRCLGLSMAIPRNEKTEKGRGRNVAISVVESHVDRAVWQYMRHSVAEVASAQQATFERFQASRAAIDEALASGDRYPWVLLLGLQAEKFFSDLVESLLGAIFVDSQGSLEACEAFLVKMGIWRVLERCLVEDGLRLLHPKEELGILAENERVRYEREEDPSKEDTPSPLTPPKESGDDIDMEKDGEAPPAWCKVFVGERQIAVAHGGKNKFEMETRAAALATEILRAEKASARTAVDMGTMQSNAGISDAPSIDEETDCSLTPQSLDSLGSEDAMGFNLDVEMT
ncbi:Dicer-like protein 2 [Agyrium rufum]|nr:Dicer-like protein 2 [Agyrium rufum]